MAQHHHHPHHPLASLPQPVIDVILQQLTPATLAVCSTVCKAWRDLPYEYLPTRLLVQSGAQATGILAAGLPRCRHVQAICVSSSKDPVWPCFAAALTQHRLPSLRELHIQHSSQTDAAHLHQLRDILQVQGDQCVLHLALTDKASLQALLQLLPLKGLASLELNVPYVAEGALQLLLHAATVQATAALSNDGSGCSGPLLPAATQPTAAAAAATPPLQLLQQRLQVPLRVGLWVCCWGSCPGLLLPEALSLHSKLCQVPRCALTACESINISSGADLAAVSRMHGLEALGINFTTSTSSSSSVAQVQPAAQPPANAAAADAAAEELGMPETPSDTFSQDRGGSGTNSSSSNAVTAGLASLAALSTSLKQLSIRGAPDGGWGVRASLTPPTHHQHQQDYEQQQQQQQQQQQHFLSALTGLTKLSLVKDRARPALPVGPVAVLTLLQELALERHGLQHPSELHCLSCLTGLKVLSLVLTVTADELQDAVQEGKWQLAGGGAAQQEQQCARVVDQLCLLNVTDSLAGAAGMGSDTHDGDVQCTCCCCCDAVAAQAAPCQAAAAQDAAVPMELLHRVQACPLLGDAGCPALLDWSWLRQLQQLEVAWLQVPHLDLSCLPASLCELDAQQPRDLTRVSITCTSTSRAVSLPRLQRLVLPHLLQVRQHPALLGSGLLASHQTDSSSSCSDASEDDSRCALQSHYEALLLLSVICGCPELKELELVQWQPPREAVLAAAGHLRFLRLLSVVAPEGHEGASELRQALTAVRAQRNLRPTDLQLQEALVLMSYPWSSVLAAR